MLCTRVSNIIQLIDPSSLRTASITAQQYYGGGNNNNINSTPIILMSARQMVEFTILECSNTASTYNNSKYSLCELYCCRSDLLGVNDNNRFVKSHLGNIISDGDLVMGYDVVCSLDPSCL